MHVEHTEIAPQHIRLTLNISKDDYLPEVEKTAKDLSKTIVLKGFRKGMVPVGMVKKMHGTQIIFDELNKKIDAEINNFIKENKMDIFGRPLPIENGQVLDIDISNPGDFVFDYELGITPSFEIKIPTEPLTYLEVTVDDKTLEEDIKYWRNRHGKVYNPETIDEDEKIKATLIETNVDDEPVEGGIKSDTQFAISAIVDADIRSRFMGKKTGDTLTGINVFAAFGNNQNELSEHILKVDAAKLNESSHFYTITITDVFNIEPAEMNTAFYELMYKDGDIEDEATFRERRKADIAKEFVGMGSNKFGEEIKKKLLIENDITLPTEFLKKLVLENKNKSKVKDAVSINDDSIDDSMPDLIEKLKWDLICSRIARENEISLNEEELLEYTKFRLRGAYLNYNMDPQFDGVINTMAVNMLAQEENRMRYAEELLDSKIIEWLVQRVPKANKQVTIEEFYKL